MIQGVCQKPVTIDQLVRRVGNWIEYEKHLWLCAHICVYRYMLYDKQYYPDWQKLKVLSPGKTFEVTFNKTGNYQYQCMLHPFMRGNVKVGVPDTAALESSTAGAPKANVTQGNEQIDE